VIDAPVRAELPALVAAMAAGLHADPGWTRVVPDDAARRRALATLLHHAIRLAHRDGTVLAARRAGTIAGGVVWAAPGEYPRPARRDVAAAPGMLALAARVGGRTVRDLGRFGAAIDALVPATPVWYVQALGVAPAAQGAGLGAALLAPVLAKADATGLPVYLETAKESNTGYYERFGFAVVGAAPLWAGGPMLWRMQRESVD
jgi:GNAT superfamily N-acetyltransferase